MPRRVYTRQGDQGQTGIAGGARVDKDDPRPRAMGDLDEVNATIGYLRAQLDGEHAWQESLHKIQKELMDAMAHLAKPGAIDKPVRAPLPEDGARWTEAWMDAIEKKLETASEYFLLPGGNEVSALCHMVRAQLRRAERSIVTLHKIDPVPACILQYVNRLSDLFFKLSREAMARGGVSEHRWNLFRDNRANNKANDAD